MLKKETGQKVSQLLSDLVINEERSRRLDSSFAFQAQKSAFGENFVFFICNLKQLDNCLSTLAVVGLRTKNFRFLVLSHSLINIHLNVVRLFLDPRI